MSTPSPDDRDGLILSVSLHALVLLIAAFGMSVEVDPTPEPPVKLVELEMVEFTPSVPVQVGPPQRAEAGDPAPPRQSIEPPRPAPPAATPVQPPPRPRATPPRPDPLPRPQTTPNARPARPSPPSTARQPEPDPSPRQQLDPTQGTGATDGASSRSGTNAGPGSGSGGDAAAEVGFDLGNRTHSCTTITLTEASASMFGSISYTITYAPNGSFVSARPITRNATLDRVVRPRLSSCRASRLPPQATQTNQSVRVTYNFRASN